MRAVLFDFGGVFITSPFAAVAAAAQRLGVDVAVLSAAVFGSYDEDNDHPWHRLERGELTFELARREITELAAAAGIGAIDPLTVLAELAEGQLVVREFVVDAVRAFRAGGLLTGIVTNNIAEFGDTWRALLPIDDLFDDVVDSSALGIRKPDVRIFQVACERLGVAVSDAVFVDDHQGNVAGARRAGLQAVCCGFSEDSTREALVELDRLALG